jgi:uncharacterized damage-inducible protein DinB
MHRSLILVAGMVVYAGNMAAQNLMITESKFNYEAIKANIMKSAEKMPDDGYSFQATKEERTWAELMGHIADAQTGMCSQAAGNPQKGTAAKLTAKGDLLKALQASFDVCDAAWGTTNDENMKTPLQRYGRDMTRLGLLIYNTQHSNESYGTMAVYLRLKGVLPPSSEKK